MTHPFQRIIDLAIAALLGGAMFAVGHFLLHESLAVALWSIVAVICLLPVAQTFSSVSATSREKRRQECLCHSCYLFAALPVVVGGAIAAGWMPGLVIAAVALSLVSGAAILTALRVPPSFSIALTIFGAALSMTWPIWAAGLLAAHDTGPWLQRMINVSPAFAINAAVSPEDALTHQPIAYRLMNLGQDISYSMPPSVWPCVALHAAIGVVGLLAAALTRQTRASTAVVA